MEPKTGSASGVNGIEASTSASVAPENSAPPPPTNNMDPYQHQNPPPPQYPPQPQYPNQFQYPNYSQNPYNNQPGNFQNANPGQVYNNQPGNFQNTNPGQVNNPNVVIVSQPTTVRQSSNGLYITSCLVFWCCFWLFGGIAFILAMIASSSESDGDAAQARTLRQAAQILNIIGVLVGLAVWGVVIWAIVEANSCGYYYYC